MGGVYPNLKHVKNLMNPVEPGLAKHRIKRHSLTMPTNAGLPPGTLVMLILRVLRPGPLHGYAIAQRIHQLSSEQLSVEEGSLYPALQKVLVAGLAKADWTTSETGRRVRSYKLTAKGLKQLDAEQDNYHRMANAIASILEST